MKWEYYAGFFDGEGCITIKKFLQGGRRWPHTYVLCVAVTGTHRPSIEGFKAAAGFGTVSRRKRGPGLKETYSWIVTSTKAYRFLSLVYPHLVTKKAEADAGMEFYLLQRRYGVRQGLTPPLGYLKEAERLYSQIKALKKDQGEGDGILASVHVDREIDPQGLLPGLS